MEKIKFIKDVLLIGRITKIYQSGKLQIMVGVEAGMWHLSISHPTRLPTYNELKEARYQLVPDNVTMAMLFPPKREFVNVHKFCFHLWQIKDFE